MGKKVKTEAISGLKVTSSTGKNVWINLPVSYTRDNLLVRDEDIATPNDWKYLERIADKIIQGKLISIGLLIGGNCSKALEPFEVIPNKDGGPYAFRTLLGWCIVGPIDETTSSATVSCNRISVEDMSSKTVASHYFATETEVKMSRSNRCFIGCTQPISAIIDHQRKEKISLKCQ